MRKLVKSDLAGWAIKLVLFCELALLSCNVDKKGINTKKSVVFIDSLCFKHYPHKGIPYIVRSCTYAYNDSMSQVLDSMNLEQLERLNSVDRAFNSPLNYYRNQDTITVNFIHTPLQGDFQFPEIITKSDTIFLRIGGAVNKKLVPISSELHNHVRYFNTQVTINTPDTTRYFIFFRPDL
jgi:hypothetical protein